MRRVIVGSGLDDGRVLQLNGEVERGVQLVEALSAGSSLSLGACARHVVRALLDALRSPLAAPAAARTYRALRTALLPRHPQLGEHVARVTLRLCRPQCDLDPAWEDEPLDHAVARTIHMLHHETVGEDERRTHQRHLAAPGFCYVFPLLKMGQ